MIKRGHDLGDMHLDFAEIYYYPGSIKFLSTHPHLDLPII